MAVLRPLSAAVVLLCSLEDFAKPASASLAGWHARSVTAELLVMTQQFAGGLPDIILVGSCYGAGSQACAQGVVQHQFHQVSSESS